MDDVAAAIAADNKELRARLQALEQSRWNRLNPRRLLPRRNGDPRASGPTVRPAIADAFLAFVEGKYELLFAHEQVAVRKRA